MIALGDDISQEEVIIFPAVLGCFLFFSKLVHENQDTFVHSSLSFLSFSLSVVLSQMNLTLRSPNWRRASAAAVLLETGC